MLKLYDLVWNIYGLDIVSNEITFHIKIQEIELQYFNFLKTNANDSIEFNFSSINGKGAYG